MMYIVHGEDSFRAARHAREMCAKESAEGAQVGIFEAPAGFEEALVFLFRPSLFPARRVALIRGAESLSLEALRQLEERRAGAKDKSAVVLLCGGRAPQKLLALRGARATELPLLQKASLDRWIDEESQRLGIRFDERARNFLQQNFGSDSGRIMMELEKLASWKPGGEVKEEDIGAVASEGFQEKEIYFFWMDGILERNAKKAVRGLARLFREGIDAVQLLSSLTNVMRTMLALKVAKDEDELALCVDSPHSFWIVKLRSAARRFTTAELKKILASILRAEYMVKTGKMEAEPALEGIVFSVTAPPQANARVGISSGAPHFS